MKLRPKLASVAAGIRQAMPRVFSGLEGLIGAGLVVYGAWLIYPPAGFIVAGVLFVLSGWLGARRIG